MDHTVQKVRAEVDPEAELIFGAIKDDNMNGKMRVSIVATALHGSETKPYLNLVNSNSNNGGSPIRNNGYSEGLFYQNKDIENIISLSKKLECEIITTEKDYLRLSKDKPQNIKFIKAKLVLADEQKLIKVF